MHLGDHLTVGEYAWQVLDIKEDQALVLTCDVVALRWYHDAFEDVTWAECALRATLNGAFFERFGPSDQARIIPITNHTPDNPWFGTLGGADTW